MCESTGDIDCSGIQEIVERFTDTNSYESDGSSTVLREDEENDYLCLIQQGPVRDYSSEKIIRRPLPEKALIKIGRLAVKSTNGINQNSDNERCIWLTSKVISRNHAEIWKKGGVVYLKDLGSSSGTFLNKARLSPSAQSSRPYPLRSNDLIQFGVDYKWKTGEMYQCVLFKVYIERRNIRELQMTNHRQAKFFSALNSLMASMNPNTIPGQEERLTLGAFQPVECCLCLGTFAPSQAIFLAPCSHCYHYRCVYQILLRGIMFQCPMCRQYANLAASVSTDSLNVVISDTVIRDSSVKQADTPLAESLVLRPSASASTPAFIPTPAGSTEPRQTARSDNSSLLGRASAKNSRSTSNVHISSTSSSSLRDNPMLKYLRASRSIPDKISNILKRRLCSVKIRENSG